jgi:hypothetical protein
MDTIPSQFDEAFLIWFRQRTEQAWSSAYPQRPWLAGLSEEEIVSLEQTWKVRFPPDYHLFLRRLHAVGEVTPGAARGRKHLMPIRKSMVVYNWLLDAKDLHRAFARPFLGLGYDQPVERAPKLIPITWYLHLLGEPCKAGNSIMAIHDADIVIPSTNFRYYLLNRFADDLGIIPPGLGVREANPQLEDIPFWGSR